MTERSPLDDGAAAYDPVAVTLHWILAVLIVASFFVGLYMVDLHFSPLRFRLFNWHKWAGMAVLVLSVARLAWRVAGHPAPPLASDVPGWQVAAYRATHLAFYGLFFVVPLAGWLYTSAVGVPVVWFGWLPLPDLTPVDKPLADALFKPLHSVSAYLLAALVVLHMAAAFKHQLMDRDHLLARMWPWWPSRSRS
jgi:cytochrome b561